MFIIGITGLSCSGKTTFSKQLRDELGGPEKCLLLSLDDYYKELRPEQYNILHDDMAAINFDTPESIDFGLLNNNLKAIKKSCEVTCENVSKTPDTVITRLPKFDLATCLITKWVDVIGGSYDYVIIEGLFILDDTELGTTCDLKIWIETSDYVCALRRFVKFTCDIKGYSPQYVYNQAIKYVIPAQEKYIKPKKKLCDLFINGEKEDFNHAKFIVQYVLQAKKLN
jgi:uridine kinase